MAIICQCAYGAITFDLTSTDSIRKAAGTVAFDLMTYYTGNQTGDTPGNLPDPYYWWDCGAMLVFFFTAHTGFLTMTGLGQ